MPSLLQDEMKAVGIYDSAHCGNAFCYCLSVSQSMCLSVIQAINSTRRWCLLTVMPIFTIQYFKMQFVVMLSKTSWSRSIQSSHASWKVLELFSEFSGIGIFLKNEVGLGKSWDVLMIQIKEHTKCWVCACFLHCVVFTTTTTPA